MCKYKKSTSKKNKSKKKREWIPVEKGLPEITKENRRTKVKSKSFTWQSLVHSPLKHMFEPIYPFFRNLEPWPTLRTWKAYFDQTWILKLKGSFLEEFSQNSTILLHLSCRELLVNHLSISDELWILECMVK